MDLQVKEIIGQLKEIQDGKLWMGANFSRKLKGITELEAFTRPLPNLHSVGEILSHLITWRQEAVLKINEGMGSITEESEQNWLPNELLSRKGWKKLQRDYLDTQKELISLLEEKDDEFLEEVYYDNDFKGNYSYKFLLDGIIHHDIYHLGQIGIVLKLLGKS